MTDKKVIIPAAKIVPEELQKLGKLPGIIYPVNQKITFDYLYEEYKEHCCSMDIICFEKADKVQRRLKNYLGEKVSIKILPELRDFELIDGVAEAIKKINTSGYLAIVVTNQPVIARGEVTFQELEEIHNKMETELGLQGAYLDAIYYCPHHPHKGYEGEVPELKIECDCRKPKPGMLLKAAGDYNIDLSQSYMIGDGENDIKAGLAAGCKAVLVNGDGTDAKNEDFGQIDTLASVLEFVDKYFH